MTFAKIDVGDGRRSKEAKGRDCTVRALTVAIAVSYETAWDMLYKFQAVQRTTSSKKGELVLDMFAGSGSTGVAAKKLGRSCLLIEKSNCKMHEGLR